MLGWGGLRFGFQCLAGVGDGDAGRETQACRAWDGWHEQRGCVRAKAFQEAAVRGLLRKGLDEEVPSWREADIEQLARLFVSFSSQINNSLVPFEIDVIDLPQAAERPGPEPYPAAGQRLLDGEPLRLADAEAPGSVLYRLGGLTADADRPLQSLCGMTGQLESSGMTFLPVLGA